MSRLRLAAVVEGKAEVAAVPVLLRRLWYDCLGGQFIDVLKPVFTKRSYFESEVELCKAVGLAVRKLVHSSTNTDPSLVLILFDRDPSQLPPCALGPQAMSWACGAYGHMDITCIVANIEYETWFVAAAESLTKYIQLNPTDTVPQAPEDQRCGKGWIESRFRGPKYSETQDQPAMTAAMDMLQARKRSPSFDKLWRELEARASAVP